MSFDEWFAQAADDLEAAKLLMNGGHNSQAVWLGEQSAEKACKALFFALGLRSSEKSLKVHLHRVDKVVEELPSVFGDGASVAELVELSELASRCRYPLTATSDDGSRVLRAPCRHPELDAAAAADAVEVAAKILEWARERNLWAQAGLAAIDAASAAASRTP